MLKLSTGARNALLATGSFRSTFGNHVIEIYSGAEPATADAAIGAAVLLCVISLNSTGAVLTWEAAAAAGAITKDLTDIWSGVNEVVGGVASFFRMQTVADDGSASTTAVRLQGNCALAGGDLNLSSLTLVGGATTTIDYGNVGLPAS